MIPAHLIRSSGPKACNDLTKATFEIRLRNSINWSGETIKGGLGRLGERGGIAAVSQPTVIIYTTDPCGYCKMAKTLFDKKGVAYEEKLVFGGTPEWEEMLTVTDGAKTVPQVLIDGRTVGGYPDLLKLQKSGELDSLLNLA